MSEKELIQHILKSYNQKVAYIPGSPVGILIYYTDKFCDKEIEVEIPKEKSVAFWEMIHSSKKLDCIDENMQTILTLK